MIATNALNTARAEGRRVLCRAQIRCISSTSASSLSKGIGMGNVSDQMLPTADAAQVLYRHTARPMTASIIGAPMTYGQPFVGTDDGPSRLREAGLLTSLSSLGWRVQDNPDLDFESIAQSISSELYATERSDAKNSLLVGHGCRHLGGRCGMVACLSVVAVTSRLATRSTDRQEKRHMSERMKKKSGGHARTCSMCARHAGRQCQ